MKVSELIELLKEVDQDFDVVVSSDGEGNSFSEAGGVSTGNFDPQYGELLDEDDMRDAELEENCLVIWR